MLRRAGCNLIRSPAHGDRQIVTLVADVINESADVSVIKLHVVFPRTTVQQSGNTTHDSTVKIARDWRVAWCGGKSARRAYAPMTTMCRPKFYYSPKTQISAGNDEMTKQVRQCGLTFIHTCRSYSRDILQRCVWPARCPICPILGFWGAKFTKLGDFMHGTLLNRSAKFDAASVIFGGEIRNRTKNKQTKLQTATETLAESSRRKAWKRIKAKRLGSHSEILYWAEDSVFLIENQNRKIDNAVLHAATERSSLANFQILPGNVM